MCATRKRTGSLFGRTRWARPNFKGYAPTVSFSLAEGHSCRQGSPCFSISKNKNTQHTWPTAQFRITLGCQTGCKQGVPHGFPFKHPQEGPRRVPSKSAHLFDPPKNNTPKRMTLLARKQMGRQTMITLKVDLVLPFGFPGKKLPTASISENPWLGRWIGGLRIWVWVKIKPPGDHRF